MKCIVTAGICVLTLALSAEEKVDNSKLPPLDADFAIQGEYEGELSGAEGKQKFGVQVIARSGGAFLAVGYRGGLPGAGWDRSEKIKAEGKTEGGVTQFPAFLGGATIKDGVMTLRQGGGKLKRVTRKSPTLGAKPPKGATVLFDGTVNDFQPGTVTPDRLLTAPQNSKFQFSKDYHLHLEFRIPYKPRARGQGRGNSGVYLPGRYEIQVLDTFGLEGKKDECGAFYGRRAPDTNMCFPPHTWQTYDVEFKVTPPTVTVRHNGVVIHKDVELQPRGKRRQAGPLHLQRHDKYSVHYRNIWFVES